MKRHLILAMFMALIVCNALASAESITDEMRRMDPRLQNRVSFTRRQISIGDLLGQLSKSSGVELKANNAQGVGDDYVFVHVKDVPLINVLNALWSLVSYKSATWHWERTGEAGAYQYELQRPLPARNLASKLQQIVLESYFDEARRCKDYLDMPKDQLKKAAEHDRQAKAVLESDRHRRGLSAFFTGLTPEQQRSILLGQTEYVRVPLSNLLEQDREGILSEARESHAFTIDKDGNRFPTPPPTCVYFRTDRHAGQLAPSLGMQIEGIGGGGHLGGPWLEKELAKKVFAAWILPGDEISDPIETKVVPAPTNEPEQPQNHSMSTVLSHRLNQLAAAAPVAIVARVPEPPGSSSWDPGAPFGRTVRENLDEFHSYFFTMQTKWRDHILIATYAGWFQEEAKHPALDVVRRLRKSAKEHNGYLPLADLIYAALRLTSEQLKYLSKDFAVMGNVAEWQELLAACGRTPVVLTALRSNRGLEITPEIITMLEKHPYNAFNRFIKSGEASSLRLVESTFHDGPLITFGFVKEDGSTRLVQGFSQTPIPKSVMDGENPDSLQ